MGRIGKSLRGGRTRKVRNIFPMGDQALTVELGDGISEEVNQRVQLLNRRLSEKPIRGIVETIPAFRSLTVRYDPSVIRYQALKRRLSRLPLPETGGTNESSRVVELPVCYGGRFGPDLAEVAARAGLDEAEVIRLHSARTYPIYMLGFLPGFPYLGGLDPRLFTPRLDSPRTRIPAGSVGIGGEQTGVYPLDSPGGWRLIGRTPLRLYDPARENPILYEAGDRIRFLPISEEEYEALAREQGGAGE